MNTPTSRLERWLQQTGLAAGLLLVFLTVGSALFWLRQYTQVPEPESWKQAATAIDKRWKKHDFVAVVPKWATSHEAVFSHFKLPYRYTRKVFEESWPLAERLWVVESYNRLNPSAASDVGWKQLGQEEFGDLTLYLYQLPDGNRTSWLATDHLEKAKVSLGNDNSPLLPPETRLVQSIACHWDGHIWQWKCPGPGWSRIQVEQKPLSGAIRKVIFAHPRSDKIIWIDFSPTTLKRELVVEMGLSRYATSQKNGAPVFVSVYAGNTLLDTLRCPNRNGWFRFVLPTTELAGKSQALRFGIRTEVDHRRHFYFDAFLR